MSSVLSTYTPAKKPPLSGQTRTGSFLVSPLVGKARSAQQASTSETSRERRRHEGERPVKTMRITVPSLFRFRAYSDIDSV